MENYSENTATAKTWKRANRFEVLNGYGATPKINIVEETIVEIGGLSVNKFNGMLTVDYDENGVIDLYNPASGEVVGQMTHNEILSILYSIYITATKKRDLIH